MSVRRSGARGAGGASDRRCARCGRPLVLHAGGPAAVTVHHGPTLVSGGSAAGMSSCCPGRVIETWTSGGMVDRSPRDQVAGMPRLKSGRSMRDSPEGRQYRGGSPSRLLAEASQESTASLPPPVCPPFSAPTGASFHGFPAVAVQVAAGLDMSRPMLCSSHSLRSGWRGGVD